MSAPHGRMPSGVARRLGLFDRFATIVGRLVSRAPFFAAAVFVVVAWLAEGAVLMATNGPRAVLGQSYQLQINTVTTVITFLLVALLQNTQARDNEALHEKVNALAEGLVALMDKAPTDHLRGEHERELHAAITELRAAIGLEDIVGADDQSTDDRPMR